MSNSRQRSVGPHSLLELDTIGRGIRILYFCILVLIHLSMDMSSDWFCGMMMAMILVQLMMMMTIMIIAIQTQQHETGFCYRTTIRGIGH